MGESQNQKEKEMTTYRNDDMELLIGETYFHIVTGGEVKIIELDEDRQQARVEDGDDDSPAIVSFEYFRTHFDINEYGER